jgi:hypothetical protein
MAKNNYFVGKNDVFSGSLFQEPEEYAPIVERKNAKGKVVHAPAMSSLDGYTKEPTKSDKAANDSQKSRSCKSWDRHWGNRFKETFSEEAQPFVCSIREDSPLVLYSPGSILVDAFGVVMALYVSKRLISCRVDLAAWDVIPEYLNISMPWCDDGGEPKQCRLVTVQLADRITEQALQCERRAADGEMPVSQFELLRARFMRFLGMWDECRKIHEYETENPVDNPKIPD